MTITVSRSVRTGVALAVLAGLVGSAAPASAAPSRTANPAPKSDGLSSDAALTASQAGQKRVGLAAVSNRPLFQLPFACGERWRLSTYPGHDDYDIDMINASGDTNNHPILASYAGTVIRSGWDNGGGNYVRIDHGNGWNTLYLHMIRRPIVNVGDHVEQGQMLGRVGSTGHSSGPHLHYEQNYNREKIEAYFNGERSGITDDATSPSKVVESHNCGQNPPNPERPSRGSVTGDSYSDIVAMKEDGSLWLYANNIERDNGTPYSAGKQIGSSWTVFNRVVGADVTGDGYTDLLATKEDGSLWMYPNNIERDNGKPYSAGKQIGTGWNAFNRIFGADVTGDGYTDLVATKPDGSLWLYPNNIERDNGKPYSAGKQIGQGWNAFDEIVGADLTGDGYTDLLARKSNGSLWMYANNIERDNGTPYSAGKQIGTGWGVFDRIVDADVTGDGYTDLLATKEDGSLWFYPNNIERDNGAPFSSGSKIGSGWNAFNRITAD